MKSWKMYCTGLVLAAGLAPAALAQGLPAITPPANGHRAGEPPPVNAPAPPAAQPPNIWDKLCPTRRPEGRLQGQDLQLPDRPTAQ